MIIPLTNRQRDMLALVERLGSAECRVIAEAFGIKPERAAYILRILRKRGLVDCSRDGRGGRWSTIANRDISLAAHEAAYRLEVEKRNERKRLYQTKRREHRRQRQAEAFEHWASTVVRRAVPANEAPRIVVAGPTSVFSLAQFVGG